MNNIINKLQTIATLCLALLLLCGCASPVSDESEGTEGSTANETSAITDSESSEDSETDSASATEGTTALSAAEDSGDAEDMSGMFTDRDCDPTYDESKCIKISLKGDSATASSGSVQISGTTVTITENATHIISGALDDGMIIVAAEDTAKLQLVFDGVNVACSTSAPLYIKSADKVFVTLVGDNSLTCGESFEAIDENNIDAAVFSKEDLTFNGTGSLNVTSPGGHGIVSKDDLVFTGGSYSITSASHAIDANDSVRIKSATIEADAGKDGIHAENTDDDTKGFIYIAGGSLTIEAEGDGISAGTYLQVAGGAIDILAGGGSENGTKESSSSFGMFGGHGGMGGHGGWSSSSSSSDDSGTSMKGLKAGSDIVISGGTIAVNSADDSIHANVSATVSGGTLLLASGDDAIHAEEDLLVSGGDIDITESYEGLEALNVTVSGGDIRLVASDDGLNAAGGTDSSGMGGRDNMFGGGMGGGFGGSSNGSIVISGGTLYINASGDGIDANGTLEISGGYTTVVGPTYGDTATLDYDKTAVITGGTFIGTGASNMAQSFSSSEQGVVAVSVSNQSAGTEIVLTDSDGKVIVSYAPELSFQVVIISTPELRSGEAYTIEIGSSSGSITAS